MTDPTTLWAQHQGVRAEVSTEPAATKKEKRGKEKKHFCCGVKEPAVT